MSTTTPVLSDRDRTLFEKDLISLGRSAAMWAAATLLGAFSFMYCAMSIIVVTVIKGDAIGLLVMSGGAALITSYNLWFFVTTTQKHRMLVAQLYASAPRA